MSNIETIKTLLENLDGCNIDELQEVADFIGPHPKPKTATAALGLETSESMLDTVHDLYRYAALKIKAMVERSAGNIADALEFEELADFTYDRLGEFQW